jgi:DNA-binding NarL/FixJ family response regulator
VNATREMATIPISIITLDPELQPRAVMDAGLVADYVDAMEGGAEFPPVVVFRDAAAVFLTDGFHRLAACRSLGKSEVVAVVHDGTREQALRYALGANAAHGARRSPGDLARAYDTAVRNGLVDPGDAKAVQAMIRCSPRRAAELTQLSRTEARDARDAEVMQKVREGKSQREVAEEMSLPRSTVQRVAQKSTVPFASTPDEPTKESRGTDAPGTDSAAPHGLILHAEEKRAWAACLAACYAGDPYIVVADLYKRALAAMRRSSESHEDRRITDPLARGAALAYLVKDYSTIRMLVHIYAYLEGKGWVDAVTNGQAEAPAEVPKPPPRRVLRWRPGLIAERIVEVLEG